MKTGRCQQHSLRSHLCYANQGEIHGQQDEQLHNQVGYLNLVANAVIVWNSVYIEKVIQQATVKQQQSANRVLLLLLQVFGDRSYWHTLLDDDKREIYRILVERVVVKDGQVESVALKV